MSLSENDGEGYGKTMSNPGKEAQSISWCQMACAYVGFNESLWLLEIAVKDGQGEMRDHCGFTLRKQLNLKIHAKNSMILIFGRWAGRIFCRGLASGATSYTSFSETQGVLFCYICIPLIIIEYFQTSLFKVEH